MWVLAKNKMEENNIVCTTSGKDFDLSHTEKVLERTNSLFSYNILKLQTGEYVIEEKFFANPFNNRYILLSDDEIERLKLS